MDEALRDLLAVRAVNLRPPDSQTGTHGFSFLGVADSVIALGTRQDSVFIWHASPGFLPITGRELTRWGLDAPNGFHWILSERPVEGDLVGLESLEVVIWGPAEVSQWLGEAILMGDLMAKAPSTGKTEPEKLERSFNDTYSNKSLSPLIDISTWMSQRGMQGLGFSPILLEARLWRVLGELKGPNGEFESGHWTLLEDPWSPNLSVVSGVEALPQSTELRRLDPPKTSWLSEERFSEEVGKLLEVRRKGSFEESELSGSVRSILLQRWTFEKDRASISHTPIQIPGWIVHFETEKILHGRNGRLYDF